MYQFIKFLRQQVIRQDTKYESFNNVAAPISNSEKIFYLGMYLFPGIVAYFLINFSPVYRLGLTISNLSDSNYQYFWLILITFGWHMALPILMLRYKDRLEWKEIAAYLSLRTVDWKGLLVIAPIFLLIIFFLSLPYMKFIGSPMENWLNTFPVLQIPTHSIFCCYEKIYGFPWYMLLFLFVGNFLGEELYYRGYLLRKTAFLGRWNWMVNGLLFTIYHFWQIPQTYPYFGLALIFSLMMIWRKNLYVVILMHLLWNLLWPLFMSYFYY